MARKRVLPKSFPLSQSNLTEIYNCCGEDIQKKMPPDGIRMTDKQQARFSETDWIQIYESVEAKRDALKLGFYGRDREAREWRREMDEILEILDAVRVTFTGRESLMVSCPKCGKQVRRDAAFTDEGEGEEAGRTFYYCSSHCRETH